MNGLTFLGVRCIVMRLGFNFKEKIMKSQYEIILDVLLETCHSLPSSFLEVLARKISNELIDNNEDLKNENKRLRNLLGKPYKKRIDLENIALKEKITTLEKNLFDNLNPEDWKNRYIKLEKHLKEIENKNDKINE